MPAVNPGISVSRVGGDAQIKAMKKVAGSLKLLYSQYRELQSFAQFGSDLDADTKARLALGERIVAALKQKNNAPVEVANQVCVLYAVVNGFLKDLSVDRIAEFETRLYKFMDEKHPEVLDAIRTTGKLENETKEQLDAALSELLKEFIVQI
jgi:F-type H+-transporting ATPase subunit alpha